MASPLPPTPHSDDTIDLPPDADSGSAAGGKICCQCGKNLEGHRRFKDSAGYWCKDCHRVDKKRNTALEGRCPDCGRMRPVDKLKTADDGSAICTNCMKERVEKAKRFALKAATEEAEIKNEKRKLYIGAGVIAAVVLIVLIQMIVKRL